MVINVAENIDKLNIKLTELQEMILCELNNSATHQTICKQTNIKPITLSKTISSLTNKDLYKDNQLTEQGKKMVNYLTFRNSTISDFLIQNNIQPTKDIYKQMRNLDVKIIIAIKNALV